MKFKKKIFWESLSGYRFSQICSLTNQGGNRNENLREWFPKELNEKWNDLFAVLIYIQNLERGLQK